MPLRLLIVDDHPAFREFLASTFPGDGLDVAGEAPDGESAIAAAETLRPDVVLLDVQLPGIDGIEVAWRLSTLPAPPAVILMSSRTASMYGRRLADAPARGFIPKSALSVAAVFELLAAG